MLLVKVLLDFYWQYHLTTLFLRLHEKEFKRILSNSSFLLALKVVRLYSIGYVNLDRTTLLETRTRLNGSFLRL